MNEDRYLPILRRHDLGRLHYDGTAGWQYSRVGVVARQARPAAQERSQGIGQQIKIARLLKLSPSTISIICRDLAAAGLIALNSRGNTRLWEVV